MNEAFRIALSYSRRGKILDEEAIKRIVNVIVQEKGIQKYLKGVYVGETFGTGVVEMFAAAGYNVKSKLLCISTRNSTYSCNMMFKDYQEGKEVSKQEEMLFKNIFLLQILLHELEHVNQKQIKAKGKGIEHDLVVLGLKNDNNQSFESYRCDPTERLAEIKAWDAICTFLEPFKNVYPSLYNYALEKKKHSITTSYVDEDGYIEEGPTYRFAQLVSSPRKLIISKAIRNIHELEQELTGTEVRLIYGLPVSKTDFDSYVKKK